MEHNRIRKIVDIIKWFNRQKPITLGFITSMSCFIMIITLNNYAISDIGIEQVLKFSLAMCSLVFFMSWLIFYQEEKSSNIFKEIDELYYRAKKVKTKGEIIILESDYRILRKKADNQGHYALLNTVKGILETKKEFVK